MSGNRVTTAIAGLALLTAGTSAEEIVWVTNPTSGVALYCHVHRPAGFDPATRYPGIVLVPGGSDVGTALDAGGRAQGYADLGFIVMHFDPDGRGLSTNGGSYTEEDYNGFLQQDGLHAVLQHLVDLPETDDATVGDLSFSYGITMAAGTLARYRHRPAVKFLIDMEGPADRADTARPHGHVPHDPADDTWWQEREAARFMSGFPGYYVRIQTELDHVQPDNDHAILLVNRATHRRFGGNGMCVWTRVNGGGGPIANRPNVVYSPADPPAWIPEGVHTEPVIEACLAELAAMPPVAGPIHVIFDLHMDPLYSIPEQHRPAAYAERRNAANWVLDVCEAADAKVTFLAVGEFYEFVLEDPDEGPALLRRLYRSGGSLGTHMHAEGRVGPHDWQPIPPNQPMPLVVSAWQDHIGAAEAAIAASFGLSDPAAIRVMDNILGTHMPSDGTARLDLMHEFGFALHQQGPDEEFYQYFKHYIMNPYRPSGDHFLAHDREGSVIVSPFGPVLGKNETHFGIPQDMRLPAVKARFLLELLNWLHDVHRAGTGRVWVTGWAAHGHDVVPGGASRPVLRPMLDWLKAHFVDETAGGYQAAAFSSATECRDLYQKWETAHPGETSFTYEPSETDWDHYPYLAPAARYLAEAAYVSPMEPVGRVRWHALTALSPAGEPYDLYVAYPSGAVAERADLSEALGDSSIALLDPASGRVSVAPTNAVDVPPAGIILVPPAVLDRELFVRGDCNADGALDIADPVSCLKYLFAGGARPGCADAADANDDGLIDLSDPVNTLMYLFAGARPLPGPFPACGTDETDDTLDCRQFPPCE